MADFKLTKDEKAVLLFLRANDGSKEMTSISKLAFSVAVENLESKGFVKGWKNIYIITS